MAVYRLGISVDDFYCMTPREAHLAFEDYARAESAKVGMFETLIKTIWESSRLIAFINRQISPNFKKPLRNAKELVRFAWEEPVEQSLAVQKRMLKAIHAASQARAKRKSPKQTNKASEKRGK